MAAWEPSPVLNGATGALGVRDFRVFFFGALVSNSGTWLQVVGTGWVVKELTDNDALVGTSALVASLPMALTSLFGGMLADRYARRTILLVTQVVLMALAAAMGALWLAEVRTLWPYFAVSFLGGAAGGFHFPAWQAFVAELVPRDLLMNAVTLNSAQFNASRLFGPALGGVALWLGGPALTFFANAASYLAALLAVGLVKGRPAAASALDRRPFADLGAAVRYLPSNPALPRTLLVATMTSLLGLPMIHLAVILARDVYGEQDLGYGALVASLGVGAVVVAPFLAAIGPRRRPSELVYLSLATYAAGIIGLAVASEVIGGCVALAVVGASHFVAASTTNTVIQLQVEESMRAKTFAVYLSVLTLGQPIGSQVLGWLSEVAGPRRAIGGAGVVMALATVAVVTSRFLAPFDRAAERHISSKSSAPA